MAAGEAFTREQQERIERARRSAESQTGMRFWLRVGEIDGEPRLVAEHLLTNLVETPRESGVLLLVAPGSRTVDIMTTSTARRRISDQAAGLAILTMTSAFTVGDLVGGLVNGFRQLADAAGRLPEGTQSQAVTGVSRLSGRAPVDDRALEQGGDILDADTGAAGRAQREPASH